MAAPAAAPPAGGDPEWLGTTNALWNTNTNWNPNTVPTTGTTATFDNAGNGNTTIDLGAGAGPILNLTFDTASAAAYTIGSAAGQTLILNASGAITVNTVTNNETVNANITWTPRRPGVMHSA
jgi:hypothetical protein